MTHPNLDLHRRYFAFRSTGLIPARQCWIKALFGYGLIYDWVQFNHRHGDYMLVERKVAKEDPRCYSLDLPALGAASAANTSGSALNAP